MRRIWISLYFLVFSWIVLDFLARAGWKSLDFLGFSRPNRAFSMSYKGFRKKKFLVPSSSSRPRGTASPWDETARAWVRRRHFAVMQKP